MPQIKDIVRDIQLVAGHVSRQPRGYCGHEVAQARIVLRRVDMQALRAILRSVIFVTESGYYHPVTKREVHIYDAARRLLDVLAVIESQRVDIQAHLSVA